jgi:hypothetical protein
MVVQPIAYCISLFLTKSDRPNHKFRPRGIERFLGRQNRIEPRLCAVKTRRPKVGFRASRVRDQPEVPSASIAVLIDANGWKRTSVGRRLLPCCVITLLIVLIGTPLVSHVARPQNESAMLYAHEIHPAPL